jgi:formylglycine-generating enzyme required for sulfatase activity
VDGSPAENESSERDQQQPRHEAGAHRTGKIHDGSPVDEKNREPFDMGSEAQHEVEITKPFYLGAYPVTQGEYEKVMGGNPSYFSTDGPGKDKVKGIDTSKLPVEQVTLDEAVKFCAKLTVLPKEKGRVYRLPTEAEWEFACRAGTKTRYYSGDGEDDLQKAGWYRANSDQRTHTVGKKKANAWGLSDLHGNVTQWCSDKYGKDYYQNSGKKNPQGPESGEFQVLRGGSWDLGAQYCRAASRDCAKPGSRNGIIGFRVVCVPSGSASR